MIRFQTFGVLDLRGPDGRELRSVLAQPRRTALLACLAVPGARGFHRRDRLMALLWPESSAERARHSLNQAIYALRRSLGRDSIVSCGDEQLAVEESRVWCDAAAFEVAIDSADYESALELHRGPMLDGFFLAGAPKFVEWLELERARLQERAAFAAWSLADAAEAEGNVAGAASWARRAGALAPDDETSLRRVVSTLARLGDRAGAIATYDAFVRRIAADPGIAPTDETLELAARIRGAGAGAPTTAPTRQEWRPPELPRPATTLIGRIAERAQLRDLLLGGGDCRLVTLTGPGGIGKTRLAQEMAAELVDGFADGVHLVLLAGLDAPALVPSAIVHAMRLPPAATDAREQLELELARREALLVLDNFDHLTHAGGFIAGLLERTESLKLLITSRQSLGLRAEWVVPLGGLSVPPEDCDDTASSDAALLFLTAARRASDRLRAEKLAPASVARICRLVEGIPLAVEFAAAWTRVLTCDEICVEIERSHRFLGASLRDVPERHRSLWAVFEQSWLMLDAAEREVFRGLAVFRGGFSRDAAAAVAGAGLEVLAGLVGKSILRRNASGRFVMLEALREFASEKLHEDDGAAAQLEERHALHYAELLRGLDDALSGATKDEALRAIGDEIDNVRAAWSAAVRRRNLQTLAAAAPSLFAFYDCRGWYAEARAVFAEAAAALESSGYGGEAKGLRAALLARQAAACWRVGERDEAEALLHRALTHAHAAGDRREAAFALDRLAMLAYEGGTYADGERLVRESLALRHELGDVRGIATSLNNLGSMAYAIGDYRTAKRFCEDCLTLQRCAADTAGAVISLQNLGYIALVLGEQEEARRHLTESLAAARTTCSELLVARARINLGNLASAVGDPALAREHFQAALGHAQVAQSDALAVEALLGAANALRAAGNARQALALASLVAGHGAADAAARAHAGRLADELRTELPPGHADAAVARGHMLRLHTAMKEIMLTGPDAGP